MFVLVSEAVGVARTRDSQDQLASLEATSNSVSALERARGSFLAATANLAAIGATSSLASIPRYESDMDDARAAMTEARDIAAANGRDDAAGEIQAALDLVNEFDAQAGDVALAFISGDSTVGQAEEALSALGTEAATAIQSATDSERTALSADRSTLNSFLDTTLIIRIILGGVAVAGGGFAMGVLIFVIIRPLRSLRSGVRSISQGNLELRVSESGPWEVRSLAEDVNHMADTMIERNWDLERAGNELQSLNETLEIKVRERTQKLSHLNEELEAEITERKATEEALLSSEERFSKAFTFSPVAIYLNDLESGKFIDVNDQGLAITGRTRDEVVGRTPVELAMWLDDADRRQVSDTIRDSGELRDVDLKLRRADGVVIDTVCSFALLDVRGRKTVLSIVRDVTESQRAQAELAETNETISALFEASPVAIIGLDTQSNVTLWNRTAESLFGWTEEEIVGKQYPLVPDDRQEEFAVLRKRAYGGEGFTDLETTRRTKSGESIDVSISVAPVRDSKNVVQGVVAVLADISARTRTEHALRDSEERYRTLFARNLAGVYRTTVEGLVIECNDALARMLGYESPEEITRGPLVDYHYPNPEERASFVERLLRDGRVTAHEARLRHKNGTSVWVLESASLSRTAENPDGIIEGTMIDITERRQAEQTIRHLAYHDTLTDLPNRSLFVDRLQQAVARSRRTGDFVSVLFLDLDNFKDVNDSVGHAEGDIVLKEVAKRLSSLLRDGDTLARFGGDEFVLLLPETTGVNDAIQTAQRILKAMRKAWKVDDREFHLSASIGITIAPVDGEDPDTLLRNADTAMYRAKEHGRAAFALYTADMNARIMERLTLENALRRAIKRREFVLHYQPQVDIATGEVVGVEALVRWQHPERGLVMPGDFIPVAEASGLIGPIGDWVLREACEQGQKWEADGLPPFRIAVNLSARQFENKELADKIASVLKQSGLARDRLQVEITEGVAMADIDFTIRTLSELRETGVQVAIDDFGTGHSSLSYIKSLPIDVVKIDGSFIRDISRDSVDAALVTAIVAISHSMGLKVIAEGVETDDQLAFLRDPSNYPGLIQDRPCDEFQGFLFSKAVPAEQIRALLTRANGRPPSRRSTRVPSRSS